MYGDKDRDPLQNSPYKKFLEELKETDHRDIDKVKKEYNRLQAITFKHNSGINNRTPTEQKEWEKYINNLSEKDRKLWKEQGLQRVENAGGGLKWEVWGDGKNHFQEHILLDHDGLIRADVRPIDNQLNKNIKNINDAFYVYQFDGIYAEQEEKQYASLDQTKQKVENYLKEKQKVENYQKEERRAVNYLKEEQKPHEKEDRIDRFLRKQEEKDKERAQQQDRGRGDRSR